MYMDLMFQECVLVRYKIEYNYHLRLVVWWSIYIT